MCNGNLQREVSYVKSVQLTDFIYIVFLSLVLIMFVHSPELLFLIFTVNNLKKYDSASQKKSVF